MRGDVRCCGGGTKFLCDHSEFHHVCVRTIRTRCMDLYGRGGDGGFGPRIFW